MGAAPMEGASMPPLIEAANTDSAHTPLSPGPVPLPAAPRTAVFNDATGLKNMQQLVQLRWIAAYGQLVTILVAHFGFGIRLPLNSCRSRGEGPRSRAAQGQGHGCFPSPPGRRDLA